MKFSRHAKVIEIIESTPVETQEELAEKLKEAGLEVTQATVSRDIKELRLIKVMDSTGKYRYAQMGQGDSTLSNRLLMVLSQSLISCDYANNILVVKTLPGMAQGVASAIDAFKFSDFIGSIAGDDTIMSVCRTEAVAREISTKLLKMKG